MAYAAAVFNINSHGDPVNSTELPPQTGIVNNVSNTEIAYINPEVLKYRPWRYCIDTKNQTWGMYNFSTASKPTAVSSAAAPAQTPEKKVNEWLHVIDVREDGTKVVEIWHTSDLESEAVKQEGPAEMAHGVQNLNLETTEDDYRLRFYKEYIARGDTESMAERLAALEAKDAAFVIKLVARLARIEAFERDGNILVDSNEYNELLGVAQCHRRDVVCEYKKEASETFQGTKVWITPDGQILDHPPGGSLEKPPQAPPAEGPQWEGSHTLSLFSSIEDYSGIFGLPENYPHERTLVGVLNVISYENYASIEYIVQNALYDNLMDHIKECEKQKGCVLSIKGQNIRGGWIKILEDGNLKRIPRWMRSDERGWYISDDYPRGLDNSDEKFLTHTVARATTVSVYPTTAPPVPTSTSTRSTFAPSINMAKAIEAAKPPPEAEFPENTRRVERILADGQGYYRVHPCKDGRKIYSRRGQHDDCLGDRALVDIEPPDDLCDGWSDSIGGCMPPIDPLTEIHRIRIKARGATEPVVDLDKLRDEVKNGRLATWVKNEKGERVELRCPE